MDEEQIDFRPWGVSSDSDIDGRPSIGGTLIGNGNSDVSFFFRPGSLKKVVVVVVVWVVVVVT